MIASASYTKSMFFFHGRLYINNNLRLAVAKTRVMDVIIYTAARFAFTE